MAFENVECINPTSAGNPVPSEGVRVSARALHLKKSARTARFIRIVIGGGLARKLSLTQEQHGLMVLFGKESDAGKIRLSVNNTTGKFRAKRAKNGSYAFTINEATAEGLFALEFETFDRAPLEAIRPENGQSPFTVFLASKQMLDAQD